MLIVDAQIHSGAPGRGRWTKAPADRRENHYFIEEPDLLTEMDEAGVSAAVIVPPLAWEETPDNRPWLEMARRHPTRFAVMGRCRAEDPAFVDSLPEALGDPEMLGMRLSFHGRRGNEHLLSDGSLDRFWQEADRLGMPVMINAPGAFDQMFDIAAAHPGVRLVVDHLGISPEARLEEPREAVTPLLRLAQLGNVAVKATALPSVVTEEYPFPRLRECLKDVIDAFGAERVFWGSDLSRLPCEYGTLVEFFMGELGFLSSDELAQIMGLGIVRWLRWESLEAHGLDAASRG